VVRAGTLEDVDAARVCWAGAGREGAERPPRFLWTLEDDWIGLDYTGIMDEKKGFGRRLD